MTERMPVEQLGGEGARYGVRAIGGLLNPPEAPRWYASLTLEETVRLLLRSGAIDPVQDELAAAVVEQEIAIQGMNGVEWMVMRTT